MPIQSHAQCADGVVRIRVGYQPACLSCVLALRLIAQQQQQQPIDSSRGPPTKSQPSASVNRSNPSPSRRAGHAPEKTRCAGRQRWRPDMPRVLALARGRPAPWGRCTKRRPAPTGRARGSPLACGAAAADAARCARDQSQDVVAVAVAIRQAAPQRHHRNGLSLTLARCPAAAVPSLVRVGWPGPFEQRQPPKTPERRAVLRHAAPGAAAPARAPPPAPAATTPTRPGPKNNDGRGDCGFGGAARATLPRPARRAAQQAVQ